jgi:nitroreductase/NAD-dependent dihydropyrimidine dehydrogenase PreA subunit
MIRVDENKCTGCGQCTKDCVKNALSLVDGKARLTDSCFDCGHCVAVCPANAVTIDGYDMTEVLEAKGRTTTLDSDLLLDSIKFRRSVRNFKQRSVEKEKILKIIEAGRYSPTAKNTQNVEYVVVQDDIKMFEDASMKVLRRAAKLSHKSDASGRAILEDDHFMFKGATALIFVISENDINATIASANMELMAEALGLGVFYVGYFSGISNHSKALRGMIGLKDGQNVVNCLALGYPAVTYRRSVPRKKPVIQWR